jgi:carboxypeptidase T
MSLKLSHRPFIAVAALALVLALSQSGSAHSTPAGPPHPHYLVVRLFFHDQAERDRLARSWDAAEASTVGGYLTVWTDQAGYAAMLDQGLRAEIDQEATAQANQPIQWNKDTFYGGYHTVEEMYAFLDQEAAAYPNLAQKVDIGDSWCKLHAPCQVSGVPDWNGYDLFVMRLSNQSIPGPKPVFWFESDIHAREIAPPEVAMRFIGDLLQRYETDADVHWLLDYHDIYVMPIFNPDGHHLVETGGDNPVLQRKNADYDDGCSSFPGLGTDLNRNFSFQWACCGGSSGAPCAEDYHGPSAGSEPETQAVADKIRALIPDQRGPNLDDAAPITTTGVFQDMHTYGSQNLYSWSFSGNLTANDADLGNIARHMGALDAGGNGYFACRPPQCLYTMDGDTFDWGYGELGIAAFSSESEGIVFFPPYTIIPNFFRNNRGMLLYLAKIARTPYLLTRGPDANLAAASPMTATQGSLVHLTTTINYAWALNSYSQTVAAAEFYVDTPPWAGGSPVAMSAVDGNFDELAEAVQADLDTSALAMGRHIIFMRGRGVNDYEGYQSWGPVSAAFVWLLGTPTPTPTGTRPTPTPTPTPTATPCYGPDPFANGGFETGGFAPWVIDSASPAPSVSGALPHSGAFAALLGSVSGREPYGDSAIYQQINVPASGGTLHFWYWPITIDNINYDWQDAYVLDQNGALLATIMHESNDARAWTEKSFDLRPYAGQTVRIKFLVHQDGAYDVTAIYLDDVQLFTPCGSPTATPTPAATSTATPTATPQWPGRLYLPLSLFNGGSR